MRSGARDDAEVRRVVGEFDAIKKSKDSMRYLPVREPETLSRLRRKRSPRRRSADRTRT